MKEKLGDNCPMKAQPHIDSKVKALRKKYFSLAEMRGPKCSKFGWNDINKSITCDDDVWNNWVKSHSTAAGVRNKSFSYYDELDYVYGKDRATGGGAENPVDAVEDITLNEQEQQAQHVESPFPGSQNVEQEENSPVTPLSANATQATTSSSREKRKRNDDVVQELSTHMTNAIEIMATYGEHIGRLANCFKMNQILHKGE
ncbi:hypothetical protein Sjap_022147 [Stephania japonica]|uniref:Myb/SANT-like domain-containing protein n=1 Tax=Stephania japonica TaxID=461633 RepID=A0AAP0EQY1_9MAGN